MVPPAATTTSTCLKRWIWRPSCRRSPPATRETFRRRRPSKWPPSAARARWVWKRRSGRLNPLSLGVKVLKFFPAGAAGGVAMLRSIAAPYLHTGVRFLPTGGINQANLSEYLALRAVLAVGGTWIATADDIAANRWNVIRDNCRNAVALADKLKPAAAAAR